MKKTLIIARHGNTFLPEQIPTRVGKNTDIDLVEDIRSKSIGKYLLTQNITIDKIYAAPLKRTMQTAELIANEMHLNMEIIPISDFEEIDYGPDENRTEEDVKLRLGKLYIQKNNLLAEYSDEETKHCGERIIELWNNEAIVPEGWIVDVYKIVKTWTSFADNIKEGETVLVATSNGIIRFAPHILDEDFKNFASKHDLKVATGSVSVFTYENKKWSCEKWNVKPYKLNY